jgi:hypothetical protein
MRRRDVGFWHFCDIMLYPLEFRLRRLNGHGAETLGRPILTLLRHRRLGLSAAQNRTIKAHFAGRGFLF